MSDDNRIILDAANFDRSMPKWASEDTLFRLSTAIKNANKEEQRILKSMQQTLRDIKRIEQEALNGDKKSTADIKKELSKIAKILTKSQSPTTSGGSSSDSSKTQKSLQDIKSSSQKSAKELKGSLDSIAKASKSSSDVLEKSVKDGSKDVVTAVEKSTEAAKKSSKDIISSNQELSSVLEKANEINERSEKLLKEITSNINAMTNRLSKDIESLGGSSSSSESTSGSSKDVGEERFRQNVLTGMNSVNHNLAQIGYSLAAQNRISSGILQTTTNKEDFEKLFEEQQRNLSRAYRENANRTGNTIRDMFENARRAESSGGASSALVGVLGNLGKGLSGLMRVLRATPIGAMLSGAAIAATAATKTAEYTYDVQKEYRDMADRGFNFRILGGEAEQDGQSRLDGITIRRTITQNEVGIETATKILEHNTRLINDLGLSNMFTEVGNVLGDSSDQNSFVNRIGMTRDQVALMVGDFYAIRNRLGSVAEEFSSLERENMAKQFVTNVRSMSQTLGVSMEEIRNHIAEFTKTDDYLAVGSYVEGSEVFKGALGASGLSQDVQDMLFYTMTSATGVTHDRVIDAAGDALPMLIPILSELREEFANADFNDVNVSYDIISRLREGAQDALDQFSTEGGVYSERSAMYQNLPQLIRILENASQSMIGRQIDGAREAGLDDVVDNHARTSEIQQRSVYLENLRQGIDAQVENAFANLADSEAGRELIMGVMDLDELTKNAQLAMVSGLNGIADLLSGGPIPRILSGIRTGIRRVIDIVSSISSFFGGGPDHDDEIRNDKAGELYDYLKNTALPGDAFERLFKEVEGDDGKTTIGLQDGIGYEELTSVFSNALANASTTEEKESIIGLTKSLERGFKNSDVQTSDDLTEAMASANAELRFVATQNMGEHSRERIEDILDGHIDSFGKIISEPMREFRQTLDSANNRTGGGIGFTVADAQRYASSEYAEAVESPRYVHSASPLGDVGTLLDHAEAERTANAAASQRTLESLRLADPTPSPAPVPAPVPNTASLYSVEEDVEEVDRVAGAINNQANIRNNNPDTWDRVTETTSEDRLQQGEDDIVALVNSTHNLVREANEIANTRVASEEESRNYIANAIHNIDIPRLNAGDLSIESDSLINLNPVIQTLHITKLYIGEKLDNLYRVLGGVMGGGSTPLASGSGASRRSNSRGGEGLGFVSEKYESGGRGVSTISTGIGDAGGVSYGTHQLASNTGTMQNFLDSREGAQFRGAFAGLQAGTEEFNRVYAEIAENHEEEFAKAQHDYITRTHYNPVAEYAANAGLDMTSEALQEAIYSQSVQHGYRGNKKIIDEAMSRISADASEEEIINAIYDSRTEYAQQFASASATVDRYNRERQDIISLVSAGGHRDIDAQHDGLEYASLNRRQYTSHNDEKQVGGILGALNTQTSIMDHTNAILTDILGSVRGDHTPDDYMMVDGGIDSDNIYGSLASVGDDASGFIRQEEVSSLINQAINDYEQRMRSQEERDRRPTAEPVDEFERLAFNTPEPGGLNDSDSDVPTLLGSINSSNQMIASAIDRNTRTLQDFINRSI